MKRPLILLSALLAACGGGGSDSGGGTTPTPGGGTPPPATDDPLYTVPDAVALSSAEVERIVAQAAEEASARTLPAVIAVTDRVGNVLAVFRMTGARAGAVLRAGGSGNSGLQGVEVPAEAAAIAKAITGAYLSSSGNAFSTRTASMIVQQHFPPAPSTVGLESGPLFGVQFSALPCSDIAERFTAAPTATGLIGPKRSPIGLSADPGGIPLYKNGVVVGGVGIMADGDYGFDANVLDVDEDNEELIAIAAATGFEAPEAIRAERIAIDGTTLRYLDGRSSNLKARPADARALSAIPGALVPVTGYFNSSVALAGSAYGTEASGVRAARTNEFGETGAFILSDGAGTSRYPIRGGTDAGEVATPLSASEARALLEEAFRVMVRARGQIREPLYSRAQMSIALVDTRGAVLGLVRAPDAPVFGIDVSVQKARTAAFFSSSHAAGDLAAAAEGDVQGTVQAVRTFLGDTSALTGKTAISARTTGNLARPHFPDGEAARAPGPFSVPIARFSPFSTGLQTALIAGNIAAHVGFISGSGADAPRGCTSLPTADGPRSRLANGIQIFPGAVPIYRGGTLVGAIGVSGDGIDQDDMAAFLGTHNAGLRFTTIGNAAQAIRADEIVVPTGNGVRLRYVACPFAPFLDSSDQAACSGK